MSGSNKRPKLTQPQPEQSSSEPEQLIPGLPDHVTQLCLSTLPPSLLFSLNHSFRRFLSSPSYPQPYLSLYALLSPPTHFFNFDPITSTWTPLPPPPPSTHFTVHHKSFLSLNLPIQSLSVNGNLVVVAATDPLLRPALSAPLIFNPVTRSWTYGPEMAFPRRWCAAGSSGNTIYVASGVGSQFKTCVSKSVEKWRFGEEQGLGLRKRQRWEKMRGMKDGRLSREAIEAIGCRKKLYMVNVKGNAVKEGFVYDTVRDEWEEMKEGMVGGWRGPAASMDEEEIYVVDERRGVLMRYEWERDVWCEVFENEMLKGAEQMTCGGGRVCVVVNGGGIVVVDVGRGRIWVVEMPDGLRANSVHVLPRMC